MQNEMNQIDRMPKKNPLSFQIDLSKFEKATDEEKKQQDVMSESASFFKDGMRKLMKNPLAVGSIIVLVAIVLMIVIVPRVVPYGYSDIVTINGVRDTAAQNMAPLQWSEAEQAYIDEGGSLFPHIMGTDEMGRDYFVRVVYGTKVSLIVGIFAALLVLIIGVVYGSISGYLGGKVDLIMMRIVDIIYSLPDMLMVVLLSVVLQEVLSVDQFPLLEQAGDQYAFDVHGLCPALLDRYGQNGAWTDPHDQIQRVCARRESKRRERRTHYPQAYFTEQHQCHHYYGGTAGAFGDFHRKLPELYRSGRQGADAVFGFACERRQSRYFGVFLQTDFPGDDDLSDHARVQSFG